MAHGVQAAFSFIFAKGHKRHRFARKPPISHFLSTFNPPPRLSIV
jgi:hypothetical protein